MGARDCDDETEITDSTMLLEKSIIPRKTRNMECEIIRELIPARETRMKPRDIIKRNRSWVVRSERCSCAICREFRDHCCVNVATSAQFRLKLKLKIESVGTEASRRGETYED